MNVGQNVVEQTVIDKIFAVSDFLEKPICKRWYTLTLEQRLQLLKKPTKACRYKRLSISHRELLQECFCIGREPTKEDEALARQAMKWLKWSGWQWRNRRIGKEYCTNGVRSLFRPTNPREDLGNAL